MGSAPSPPPPPDYAGAAKEQGAANIEAARASGKMNNPNVINPLGTQSVTWDGDEPTLTQTYSPSQQAIFEASNRSKLGLAGLAEKGTGLVGDVIGKNVNFAGMPPEAQGNEAMREQVINANMARVDEDTARKQDEINSTLIAGGIRPGTKAYDDQMALLERQRTDARNQIVGGAQQQVASQYGLDAERRRAAIGEYLQQRQVPLNEITALMSGSQVSNPFAIPGYSQNANIAAPPIYQAATDLAGYNTDVFNAKSASGSALTSGLMSLGGSAMMAGGMAYKGSDRRIKQWITRLKQTLRGLPLYRFMYQPAYQSTWGAGWRIGVMADEVFAVYPEAVQVHPDGYLMVDYAYLQGA